MMKWRASIPDDESLVMIPPELRAGHLRRTAALSELLKPSPGCEAKKTLDLFPTKPSVRNSHHLPTPIRNDVNSKLSRAVDIEVARHESTAAVKNQRFRLFGVDIAIAPESTKQPKFHAGLLEKLSAGEDVSLPGSISCDGNLGLFPLAPIKEIVDLELSLGCGSGNRKVLEEKMTKKADLELESDGAPVKNGVNLETSLSSGSGNGKAPVNEKKKAGHGLESDGTLYRVHRRVTPQRKN